MGSGVSQKPAIPDQRPEEINDELWRYLQSIKEIVESYEGSRGKIGDQIVTKNDLIHAGIDLRSLNKPAGIRLSQANIGGEYNHTEFENDGTMIAHGNATVWDDLQVQLGAVRIPPAQAATIIEYQSGLAIEFANGSTERINFNCQIPHARKDDSDIEFHIHVIPSNTDTGNIYWEFEYEWKNIGETYGSSTTIYKATAMDGVADVHQYDDIVNLDGSGKSSISSILLCTLTRLGSHANDTFTGDAYIIGLDFHIEKDSIGSRKELIK
jgi:hypothetical protein